MMKSLKDLREELLEYNANVLVSQIREKYNTPSFFEMVDKTRSETAHSAFLSWMLKGQGVSEMTADSPLYLFLAVIAGRSLQQETKDIPLMNETVRDAILSRKIRISGINTQTEESIGKLAEIAYDSFDNKEDDVHKKLLSGVIASVADRVDIIVKCDVENCGGIKHLIILIENKVDSNEGQKKTVSAINSKKIPSAYSELSQTERYYEASYHKDGSDTAVLYVFLNSKLSNAELATLSDNREQLKDAQKCAQCDHYVNINYQDLLNGVIDKVLMLNKGSISARTRNFLEEYKNEITYPHIYNPKTHINIAYPTVVGIEDLWLRFRFLFHCVAYSKVSTRGCVAVDDGVSTRFESSLKGQEQSNIKSQPINSNTLSEAGVLELLSDFADENLDILATIIGAVKYSSEQFAAEADTILKVLMSGARDNTKYLLAYNGTSLTSVPVSKSEAVYLIFKEWANVNNATLSSMREAFPVSVNPYFASGKLFQHLFYQHSINAYHFDGKDSRFSSDVIDDSNWHFYRDNKHKYNGIVNLKFWQNDAFESLIAYLREHHATFANLLTIYDTNGNSVL